MNTVSAFFAARTWRAYGYLWVALLLAPFSLAYVLLVPSLGAGFLVTVVGLFVAGGLVVGARGWGSLYRGLARAALGEHVAAPPAFVRPRGFWRSLGALLFDGTGWRALLFMFVTFPLTIFSFVVSTVFLAVGLGGITYWLWWQYLPWQETEDGLRRGFSIVSDNAATYFDTPPRIAFLAVVGLVFLIVWPWVTRGLTTLFHLLTRGLLGPTAGSIRVAALRDSRAAAVEDADARLRRIERDLHDGTQARLVAVAMQLGDAREQLATDPALAAELLETAHASTKEALTELREIARGIHPPALDDGLAVALETLAARSPLPVTVDVDPAADAGLAPAVRSIAYYTVGELLTNVVKHARATGVYVVVDRPDAGTLHVRVRDDGRGGAVLAPGVPGGSGTGLAGLAERVATVDGTFALTSPVGGPTVVDVTLPTRTRP
ncbi:histidine kinase [Xylanimonas cellulosilytica DSM 15894]|uniref:histidine kinase n=1 Tax=Xylanimonas cellulosilytica (strain DSM 15894 / JCM 12276 / CECT 5975 / KCTC 9989 / LMG 20990 / NBRC 107835 / XIL07) TaxID=446471 RepID=D1BWJ5_XYLCX|nr:sensor domain-containing protein [Xylanimonas cellulosilytica]ACZ31540.1 histidine kinase [Xylanimonas cellulosilytica DSM 15894]